MNVKDMIQSGDLPVVASRATVERVRAATRDQVVLLAASRAVAGEQSRMELRADRTDLSPAAHDALTRAAQMLSIVAHDLREAAGEVE